MNYEAFRQRGAVTTPVVTVPTMQERTGDFSDLLDTSGHLIPIYDPATTGHLPDGTVTRDQFMGCNGTTPNVICASDPRMQNSMAPAWLKYLPAPNKPGITGNFSPAVPPSPGASDGTILDVRADHYYGSSDHFDVTVHYHGTFGPVTTTFPAQIASEVFMAPNYFFHDTLSWDHTISPSLINTFHFGYNQNYVYATPADQPYASLMPQIKGVYTHDIPSQIGLGQYGQLGGNFAYFEVQPNYIVNDVLMAVRGKHTLRFGGEVRAIQDRLNWFASNLSGEFDFGSLLTGLPTEASGNSLASFLLGGVSSGWCPFPTVNSMYPRQKIWNAFASDTWKATPKLTFDLGIRWDVSTPAKEKWDHMSLLDPHMANPGAGGLPGALVFAGTKYGAASLGRDYPEDIWYRGFGPRVGIAYSLTPKTVVRTGYGIFYQPLSYRSGTNGMVGGTDGFNTTASFNSPDNGVTPAFQLVDGLPQNFTRPPFISTTFDNGNGVGLIRPFGRYLPPNSQQWNLTIEHQFSNDFYVSAGYVGNQGSHLISIWSADNTLNPSLFSMGNKLYDIFQPGQTSLDGVNAPYSGWVEQMRGCSPSVAQALLRFPQYCAPLLPTTQGNASSSFNSFQLKAEKRMSNGLWVLGSYMFSKFITSQDSQNTRGYALTSAYQMYRDKGLSVSDVPNSLTISVLYDLPVGKGKRFLNTGGALDKILGGWQVTSIFRGMSGTPLIFGSGVCNIPGQFFMGCMPGVLHGANPRLQNGSFDTSKPLFDKAAFEPANSFNFYSGAASAVSNLRGFPLYNHDLGVAKTVPLKERVQFTIGGQFFNAWNWHSFVGQPITTDVASPSFGLWNGSVSTPRNIQIYARFTF